MAWVEVYGGHARSEELLDFFTDFLHTELLRG